VLKAYHDLELAHSKKAIIDIDTEEEPLKTQKRVEIPRSAENIIVKVPVPNGKNSGTLDKRKKKVFQNLANTLKDKFMELFEDIEDEKGS
jgi:hypothetical protein